MPQVQREQAVAEFVFHNPFFNLAGEFAEPAPARLNCQFVKMLPEHFDFAAAVYGGRNGARKAPLQFKITGSRARPCQRAIFQGRDCAAGRRRAPSDNESGRVLATAAGR